jgi:transcriptional regulator
MLYQPTRFQVDDRAAVLDLMHAHPFATLVTIGDGEPGFTHLPLHPQVDGESLHLLGHVARANPHWRQFDVAPVTAIFHGADAFISPRWYGVREAVPTWNYMVVHALGRIVLLHDSESKESILKQLIDVHDPAYHALWDALDLGYRERMKSAIVGLRIEVARVEAKFKLSQNRSATDRGNVLAAMDEGDPKANELAAWMRRLAIGAAS